MKKKLKIMTLNDLPEIKITRKINAKNLRLRVDAQQIRLTAPLLCSQKQIRDFIQQSEHWLIETWQKQQKKIASFDRTLPETLSLFNLTHPIHIQYQPQKQNFYLDIHHLTLVISDRHPEIYLKTFVIAYAKQHLPHYLNQVSQEIALKFQHCNIRQPKTRWGSCSAKHDIMLNSAVVLCPKAVVRYLCVHELAHTQHFDHSPQFWAEVAKHDAHFQQHRRILKQMVMPFWWSVD